MNDTIPSADDGYRYMGGVMVRDSDPPQLVQRLMSREEERLWAKALVVRERNRAVWTSEPSNNPHFPGTIITVELVSNGWFAVIESRRRKRVVARVESAR